MNSFLGGPIISVCSIALCMQYIHIGFLLKNSVYNLLYVLMYIHKAAIADLRVHTVIHISNIFFLSFLGNDGYSPGFKKSLPRNRMLSRSQGKVNDKNMSFYTKSLKTFRINNTLRA